MGDLGFMILRYKRFLLGGEEKPVLYRNTN